MTGMKMGNGHVVTAEKAKQELETQNRIKELMTKTDPETGKPYTRARIAQKLGICLSAVYSRTKSEYMPRSLVLASKMEKQGVV